MLAERYGCILFDLDGVLYRGEDAVPQAPPTMAELRRRGVRPVFLTNNSSRTPRQVADKLRAIGFEDDPQAFADLTGSCNSCHEALNHGFLVMKVPEVTGYANQDFRVIPGVTTPPPAAKK